MDYARRYKVTGFTATHGGATLWPFTANPRTRAGGKQTGCATPRLDHWPEVCSGSQFSQSVVDEALRRIESGEFLVPSPDVYELAGDEVFAFIMSQVGDACDDGENPYVSGIPKAVRMLHAIRLLDKGRPASGEDVRYLSQVGFRLVFQSRSGRLIRVEPGLVESRHWAGNFVLSNPLWDFTLSGHDLLDSGSILAARLRKHGITCDAAELDGWLRSGLRARLLSAAYPDPVDPDDCEGGVL
jgi:hypothetical protein